MTPEQEEQIKELYALRMQAFIQILASMAKEETVLVAQEWFKTLKRDGYTITADAEEIAESVKTEYLKGLNRGGTMCVERVLEPMPDGRWKATTEQKFVQWLYDKTTTEANEIIQTIQEAEQSGVHPKQIEKLIRDKLEGQNHNSMTAARTEAAKIRNDARSKAFVAANVEYVMYVTAGDDRVRPEHAMRNGKIYRHEDAPYLGEYNCRCTLYPANYEVKYQGAKVESSHAEYLTDEQVMTAA